MFALSSTHAECIKAVVYILLSVDVRVLPYYIYASITRLFTYKLGMI